MSVEGPDVDELFIPSTSNSTNSASETHDTMPAIYRPQDPATNIVRGTVDSHNQDPMPTLSAPGVSGVNNHEAEREPAMENDPEFGPQRRRFSWEAQVVEPDQHELPPPPPPQHATTHQPIIADAAGPVRPSALRIDTSLEHRPVFSSLDSARSLGKVSYQVPVLVTPRHNRKSSQTELTDVDLEPDTALDLDADDYLSLLSDDKPLPALPDEPSSAWPTDQTTTPIMPLTVGGPRGSKLQKLAGEATQSEATRLQPPAAIPSKQTRQSGVSSNRSQIISYATTRASSVLDDLFTPSTLGPSSPRWSISDRMSQTSSQSSLSSHGGSSPDAGKDYQSTDPEFATAKEATVAALPAVRSSTAGSYSSHDESDSSPAERLKDSSVHEPARWRYGRPQLRLDVSFDAEATSEVVFSHPEAPWDLEQVNRASYTSPDPDVTMDPILNAWKSRLSDLFEELSALEKQRVDSEVAPPWEGHENLAPWKDVARLQADQSPHPNDTVPRRPAHLPPQIRPAGTVFVIPSPLAAAEAEEVSIDDVMRRFPSLSLMPGPRFQAGSTTTIPQPAIDTAIRAAPQPPTQAKVETVSQKIHQSQSPRNPGTEAVSNNASFAGSTVNTGLQPRQVPVELVNVSDLTTDPKPSVSGGIDRQTHQYDGPRIASKEAKSTPPAVARWDPLEAMDSPVVGVDTQSINVAAAIRAFNIHGETNLKTWNRGPAPARLRTQQTTAGSSASPSASAPASAYVAQHEDSPSSPTPSPTPSPGRSPTPSLNQGTRRETPSTERRRLATTAGAPMTASIKRSGSHLVVSRRMGPPVVVRNSRTSRGGQANMSSVLEDVAEAPHASSTAKSADWELANESGSTVQVAMLTRASIFAGGLGMGLELDVLEASRQGKAVNA